MSRIRDHEVCYLFHELKKTLRPLSRKQEEFLQRAYSFAEECHRGQMRDQNVPFFYHVTRVAYLVATKGKIKDVDVIAAALLHDSVESGAITFWKIQSLFSKRVARFVKLLTNRKNNSKFNSKNMVEYIQKIAQSNDEIRIIKLCDRIDNVRCLPYNKEKNKKRYIAETMKHHVHVIGSSSQSESVKKLKKILMKDCNGIN